MPEYVGRKKPAKRPGTDNNAWRMWSCGPKKIYVDPEVHPKGLNRQCYMCKKVEMNGGTWAHILHDRAETNHCLCPVCAPKEMARVIQTAEEVNNQFAVLEPVL